MFRAVLQQDSGTMQKSELFRQELLPLNESLYNFAYHLTYNQDDALDLVQETYLKAFKALDQYQRDTNAKAWLFRILRNTFINQYRQKARQPYKVDYEDFIVHHDDEDSPFRNQTDLSVELFNQMMGDEVTAAVNSLGETYRNVIILADIEEFSYDEIAKILDVPVGTVRSRLHRARKLLKDQLERYAASLGYSENG